MKTQIKNRLSIFGFLFFILHPSFCLHSFAQGTAFTYQGRLNDSGAPANGTYDLRFTIYDSTNLPGVVIAGPLTNSSTIVTNGLFIVAFDFGTGVFTGPDRWLEIGVRTNGAGAFSTLPARQPITPTPYAINAANLGGGLHVDSNNTNGAPNIIGGSQLNQVDPGVVGAVIAGGGTTNFFGLAYSNRVAGNFSTVGGGIGNVNQSYGSVIAGGVLNQIQTGGTYSGIGSGAQNLIESGTDESFIAGGFGNSVRSHAYASIIGSGQFNTNGAAFGVIAGGQNNAIEPTADWAVILGGANNSIRSNSIVSVITGGHDSRIQGAAFAFIGAGGYHQILSNATDSAIVSGAYNTIQPGASESFIGNGGGNTIGTNSSYSSIVGGQNNSILESSQYSTIGGGYNNSIQTNSSLSVIAGGHENVIQNASYSFIGAGGYLQILSNAYDSAIVAGGYSVIQPNANGSFIGGGYSHTIQSNSLNSFIGGGLQNTIQTNSPYSVIGGGYLNVIQVNDYYSTIGGGGANTIQTNASYSTISGGINCMIQSNAFLSTIGGGDQNVIQTNASFATIPGGAFNIVAGQYGFAAGLQAQALHQGSFVWADSQNTSFASTVSNQFNVRAQGGARFVTGGAGVTVDGQPVLTSGNGISLTQNTNGAPNIIEGSPLNYVPNYVVGATISGGGVSNYFQVMNSSNSVTDNFGTVGGGYGNTAGFSAVIGGGSANFAFTGSTVSGGYSNRATGLQAFIGGGSRNLILASEGGTIGGGELNTNAADFTTVGGGLRNSARAIGSTVGGGENNISSGLASTVAGGLTNIASGAGSFIGGGGYDGTFIYGNTATGVAAVVTGGLSNNATGNYATVGGGGYNVASGLASTAAGGAQNSALGQTSTIGGGGNNIASVEGATVSGGYFNTNNGLYATVAGGTQNLAGGTDATVSGGVRNLATNSFATVPGGSANIAGGQFSFAAGQQAQALHAGSFVWADSQNASFASTISNQFSVRAANGLRVSSGGIGNIVQQTLFGGGGDGYQSINFNGFYDQAFGSEQRFNTAKSRWRMVVDQRGTTDLLTIDNFNGAIVTNFVTITTNGYVGIGTSTPTNKLQVLTAYCTGTAWVNNSDRNMKENFAAVNAVDVLQKIAAMPIDSWTYKSQPGEKHIGPMAQDFHAAFGLGDSDRAISTVDEGGVALAAIKGLNQKLDQKEFEITELQQKNESLEKRLAALEEILRAHKSK